VNSHILSYLTYPKKWLAPPPFKNPGYASGQDHTKIEYYTAEPEDIEPTRLKTR
jgi:hypothetical protein